MNEKRKHKRHWTRDLLTVFDRETGRPMAELGNLSSDGAMFITSEAVTTGQRFKCRLELSQSIMDQSEILLDAECEWCIKNKTSGRWESGYHLNNISTLEAEIISYLILEPAIDQGPTRNPVRNP